MSDLELVALWLISPLLYAGSLAIWPIYRVTRRGREPDRALHVLFLVHLATVAAWTALEIHWKLQGGDWLHGLVVYVVINVLFGAAYAIVWASRRMGAAWRS